HLFLTRALGQLGQSSPSRVGDEALAVMTRYAWPGNVRELRNAVERAALLCVGPEILPEHLPAEVRAAAAAMESRDPAAETLGHRDDEAALRERLDEMERSRVLDALARASGNQTVAARLLGISRGTMLARLNEYGLPRPRRRS